MGGAGTGGGGCPRAGALCCPTRIATNKRPGTTPGRILMSALDRRVHFCKS